MKDQFKLSRFVDAQSDGYAAVRQELARGSKTGHWMWYVFPQIAGLGQSTMSQRFAITCLDEARAYLAHPVLGPRLQECTQLVIVLDGPAIRQVFSDPDDLKFHSCMTLFDAVAGGSNVFRQALEKYFNGVPDQRTVQLLQPPAAAHAGD